MLAFRGTTTSGLSGKLVATRLFGYVLSAATIRVAEDAAPDIDNEVLTIVPITVAAAAVDVVPDIVNKLVLENVIATGVTPVAGIL